MNLLLQREDPNIYLVADELRALLQKLLSQSQGLKGCYSDNHLDDSSISNDYLMGVTLQTMDIRSAVRAFYMDAASQALKKLPFADSVINHAKF